jgi:hypothetical protein
MLSCSTMAGREAVLESTRRMLSRALLFIALLLLASVAWADEDELPDRVGRVASVAGQLYLSPEDRASDWAPIGLNYPVTSGDNLWVSGDGQAEVDYGAGQFRIAGDTSVHVSRLDDRQLALFVAQGRLIVRLRFLDAGESVQIDTPITQVQLHRVGLYRIDVAPDGQATSLMVREGEANVWLGGAAQQALPGQTVSVSSANPALVDVSNGVGVDEFDTWSAERDRRYEGTRSTPYVSRQMIGASDLDYFGQWESYPEYGAVWFPNAVDDNWAPYRDGYWTTVGAWGLTWVDAAPWGYAPFHYGRWARIRGRWGWCPGTHAVRPAWAPALVGWYGGPSWSHSQRLGRPVYGWVPLAWGEPYHPSWSNCSNRCWTRHNRPYAVDVRQRPPAPPHNYANLSQPNAGTVVTGANLVRSKPLPMNAVLPVDVAVKVPVLAAAPQPVRTSGFVAPARPGGWPVPASTIARQKPLPVNTGASFETRVKPAPVIGGRPAPGAAPRIEGRIAPAPAPRVEGRIAPAPAPRVEGRIAPAPAPNAPDTAGRVTSVPPARYDGTAPRPRPAPVMPVGPETNQAGGRSVAVPTPQPPAAVAPAERAPAERAPMDRARMGAPLPAQKYINPAPAVAPAHAAVPGVATPAPQTAPVAPPPVHRVQPVREPNVVTQGGPQGGAPASVPPAAAPGGAPSK